MAEMQGMQQMAAPGRADTIGKLTNLTGAAVSLALIVGIGVWSYKLLVRDVSGIPVVRAAEGPVRVQPEDPGGSEALHQGLSVNNVAAEGAAADPADRLVLAPAPLELTLEDAPPAKQTAETAVASEVTPSAEAAEPKPVDEEAVQLAAVEAFAEKLAQGVVPLEEIKPKTETTPAVAIEAPRVNGGLARSLRPRVRPASLSVAPKQSDAAAEASTEIDPATIPVGTRLAQLGAYESVDVARQEWVRLSGKFSEYLEDKDRVIQKAQSGGRTFYRLRAMGFADINDARRFCSALVAERAECIPVVAR